MTISSTNIDDTKPVEGSPTTQSVRDNFTEIKTQLDNAEVDINAVELSVSNLTDGTTAHTNFVSTGIDDNATSTQATITDTETAFGGNISLADNKQLICGTDNDLDLQHSGTACALQNHTGDIVFDERVNSGLLSLRSFNSAGAIKDGVVVGGATPDVKLYYGGVLALKTTAGQGASIAGSLNVGVRNSVASTDRISVSTATTIFSIVTGGSSVGASSVMVIVNGYNTASPTNSFTDIVVFISGVAPVVVSGSTVNRGSPATRTYTASGANLQLAMSTGTYNVANSSVEQAC